MVFSISSFYLRLYDVSCYISFFLCEVLRSFGFARLFGVTQPSIDLLLDVEGVIISLSHTLHVLVLGGFSLPFQPMILLPGGEGCGWGVSVAFV